MPCEDRIQQIAELFDLPVSFFYENRSSVPSATPESGYGSCVPPHFSASTIPPTSSAGGAGHQNPLEPPAPTSGAPFCLHCRRPIPGQPSGNNPLGAMTDRASQHKHGISVTFQVKDPEAVAFIKEWLIRQALP